MQDKPFSKTDSLYITPAVLMWRETDDAVAKRQNGLAMQRVSMVQREREKMSLFFFSKASLNNSVAQRNILDFSSS